MIHLLGNGKQQIVTHGNPNLCEDSILCRSEERLDMEVLLDPFEEQLNLPTLAVKFRYCYRLKSEIISQESVYIVGVEVLIDHHPHYVWIVLGHYRPCEPDALVADEACMHVNFPFLNDLETHVVFSPGDKVSLPDVEVVVKPPKIHIALVHQVVSPGLNWQNVKPVHVVYLTLAHPDECWNGTSQVKQGMHLECTLSMVKLGPGAEFQAKLYGAAVERIHHLVKTKTEIVSSIQPLSPGNKDLGEVTIYLPVFILVELCKRGLMHQLQTCVVKLGGKRGQCGLYHPKAGTSRELGETHDLELVTTRELLRSVITLVFVNTFSQLIIRDKVHQLGENGFSGWQDDSKLDKYYIQKNEIFIYKFTNRRAMDESINRIVSESIRRNFH